ncbi:MAG TPA: acetyltransferase [Candidatus Coprenecus pullistercoris]|nr:acetyltransferase [Candidatus Coprenecus pullistercoris]
MRQLIIIGAGGMGRVMYDMARESLGYGDEFVIKGYIDDNPDALAAFAGYPPVLSSVPDYRIEEEDVFICSIGGAGRRQCMESVLSRGGEFLTLIHRTARIGTGVVMGKGNMVGAFTTVAANAVIGDYNFIQSYTIIGHDVVIGDWNRIDSHVMCVGGIRIGSGAMIHTSAVLNHQVSVGDGAHVGACSFVLRDVEPGTTVMGNPARRVM